MGGGQFLEMHLPGPSQIHHPPCLGLLLRNSDWQTATQRVVVFSEGFRDYHVLLSESKHGTRADQPPLCYISHFRVSSQGAVCVMEQRRNRDVRPSQSPSSHHVVAPWHRSVRSCVSVETWEDSSGDGCVTRAWLVGFQLLLHWTRETRETLLLCRYMTTCCRKVSWGLAAAHTPSCSTKRHELFISSIVGMEYIVQTFMVPRWCILMTYMMLQLVPDKIKVRNCIRS